MFGCCVIVMRVNLKVQKENATYELLSAIIDFITHCIVIHFGRKMSPESINVMYKVKVAHMIIFHGKMYFIDVYYCVI